MGIFELFFIAVGLSIDTFAVSVCKGLSTRQLKLKHYFIIGAWFGGFQALMPSLGYLLGSTFEKYITQYDHWIAFGLLFFLGVRMIKESFDKDEENHHFNPKRLPVILTLAVAPSIDALAVGISFACTGMDTLQDILWPIVIIGIVSFLFSMLGCFIGVFFGKRINLRAELWAGIILIGIGVKILMEHMEWI